MRKQFTLYFIYCIQFCFNILSVKSQLIYTDEVPFVFFSSLQVFPTPASSIIDFSSKQFQNIPDIVIGIQSFSQLNPPARLQFQVGISSISKTSCQITSQDNIGIQQLTVSILAIDKTNFPNFQVIRQSTKNLFQDLDSIQHDEVRQFSQTIQSSKGNKIVVVFLNGWTTQSGSSIYSISVNATLINDQYYKISFYRRKSSQMITQIDYTIVELIQDSDNSIYNILPIYDQQYSFVTDFSNCLIFFTCPDRHVKSQFEIPDINNIQIPNLGYKNIFIAFNKFDYNFINSPIKYPNIELSTYDILNSRQFSFSYFVKNQSTFYGVTASAIFFYQKKCLQANQKLQGNQCISDCINVNPIQPQFCLDCQFGQYFLQDQNICQSAQPSSSYTCYPEKNYQTCVLCSPLLNCKTCQTVSNQLQCLQCEQNYYVYKGTCQLQESSSSSVSDTAQAAAALSLVSSAQGSNFMFLTLQKLNLLYMINVLFTSELTVFINQIKGTNPISYFININFISKHIFVESSEEVESQQLNSKVGQTSLLINGGGVIVSIIITIIIFTSVILVNNYLNQYSKYQEKKRKIDQYQNNDYLMDTFLDIKLFKIPKYDPKKEFSIMKKELPSQYYRYQISKSNIQAYLNQQKDQL
ncbi:hypothetical protein ABPG74_022174 [Tetrahymena malaccensis]